MFVAINSMQIKKQLLLFWITKGIPPLMSISNVTLEVKQIAYIKYPLFSIHSVQLLPKSCVQSW